MFDASCEVRFAARFCNRPNDAYVAFMNYDQTEKHAAVIVVPLETLHHPVNLKMKTQDEKCFLAEYTSFCISSEVRLNEKVHNCDCELSVGTGWKSMHRVDRHE